MRVVEEQGQEDALVGEGQVVQVEEIVATAGAVKDQTNGVPAGGEVPRQALVGVLVPAARIGEGEGGRAVVAIYAE